MSNDSMAGVAGKYLTFRLADEEYGLQILKVQEIIGLMAVTRVPKTPEFIRGVINLRGKVIPVIDLRRKFDLTQQDDTDVSCIIVVQVENRDATITMGIIVDSVSEVMDIETGQVEPAPEFGSSVDTEFILGMGKVGEKVVMLLDSDRVLTTDDVQAIAEASRS
ncbi:MAG: chemotaxis protein CheW [Planctomycetota bacterium]